MFHICRPTAVAVVTLAAGLTLSATATAQTTPAARPKTATRPAVKATTPAEASAKPVQPRLVPLNVEKCVGCATSVRKRIGVMPVKVGGVSSELGMPGEVVSDKVRDALEATVARSPKLLAVNRTDLGDVLAEQRLAGSGAANAELAPLSRAIIPAQILLYATVDRADVSVKTVKHSNNTAADYYRQALAKEQQAAAAQQRARQAQSELEQITMSSPRERGVDTFIKTLEGMTDCSRMLTPAMVANCENQKRQSEQRRLESMQRDRERELQSAHRRVSMYAQEAQQLQSDADMLRRKADIESRKEVTETRTTALNLAFTWRAIDTSTGAVVASGQSAANRAQHEHGTSSQSAFQSSEQTSSTRHDALVNAVLGDAMQKLAADLDSKLAPVPFRAKVVKTDAEGVFINAGANLGLTVGDTFGVREKSDTLTDPDTGEILSTPGAPVGYIRVVEVFEKTARAQVVREAVPVRRGDELEWIGVFVEAQPGGVR